MENDVIEFDYFRKAIKEYDILQASKNLRVICDKVKGFDALLKHMVKVDLEKRAVVVADVSGKIEHNVVYGADLVLIVFRGNEQNEINNANDLAEMAKFGESHYVIGICVGEIHGSSILSRFFDSVVLVADDKSAFEAVRCLRDSVTSRLVFGAKFAEIMWVFECGDKAYFDYRAGEEYCCGKLSETAGDMILRTELQERLNAAKKVLVCVRVGKESSYESVISELLNFDELFKVQMNSEVGVVLAVAECLPGRQFSIGVITTGFLESYRAFLS